MLSLDFIPTSGTIVRTFVSKLLLATWACSALVVGAAPTRVACSVARYTTISGGIAFSSSNAVVGETVASSLTFYVNTARVSIFAGARRGVRNGRAGACTCGIVAMVAMPVCCLEETQWTSLFASVIICQLKAITAFRTLAASAAHLAVSWAG